MAQYNSTLLLADVRSGGMFPAGSASTLSDADLLRFADQETQIGLVPLVMGVREEHFTTHVDRTITPGAALNTLRIPSRAIGGKLLEVEFIDTVGGGGHINISQINQGAQEEAREGFYVEGNTIVLSNRWQTWPYTTVRLSYHQRPNRLVPVASVGTISTIVGLAVTVGAMPTSIVSAVAVDLVRSKPAHECLAIDRTDHAVVGNTITFTGALPADLAIGDYVCLAEETPVPQVPTELQPALVQRVIIKALEAIGDREGMAAAKAKLQEIESAALLMLTPRVDCEPKKVVNHGGPWRRRVRSWL